MPLSVPRERLSFSRKGQCALESKMHQESLLIRFLYFLRAVALVDVGILILVGLVGLLASWRTPGQFGPGLVLAGLAACLIGASSVIRSLGLDRNAEYQYAQSVGTHSMADNVRRAFKESRESYAFLAVMLTAGVIAFGVGALLGS